MWVKQTFEEADKNGDGLLNIEEIHQLMHKLNVNLPRRKVRQMFQVCFFTIKLALGKIHMSGYWYIQIF